jgi:hypothetical protein
MDTLSAKMFHQSALKAKQIMRFNKDKRRWRTERGYPEMPVRASLSLFVSKFPAPRHCVTPAVSRLSHHEKTKCWNFSHLKIPPPWHRSGLYVGNIRFDEKQRSQPLNQQHNRKIKS